MAGETRPIVYVLGGFGLAVLSVAVGTLLAACINPLAYPDIRLACRALGEGGPQCAAGALHAGSVSLLGLCVATALAWALRPPTAASRGAARLIHERVAPLALGVTTALAIVVLVGQIGSLPSLSRVKEITHHAAVISIANLGFPLLLQLAARAPQLRLRVVYLAAVATLLCITPFRATFLAVLVFGVVLPVVEPVLGKGSWRATLTRRRLALGAGGVLAVGVLVAGLIVYQTAQRSEPLLASAPQAQRYADAIVPKLVQRIAYPIYQAHFAKVLAETERLPSALDEVMAKLRLTKHANLNEALYRRIYGPGSAGETTSLYYGEAAARSALVPLAWVVAAPLLYVLAWLGFARRGFDVGILAGLAIWRGSLTGAFSVLPAFVVQSAVLILLTRAPGLGKVGPRQTTEERP